VSHTLLPNSVKLRDPVSPQIGLLGALWEVISLPICLLSQAWVQNQVLTSVMGSTPLGASCPSLGFVVRPRPSPWLAGRMRLSSGSNCLLAHDSLGDAPWRQGRWQVTVSTIPHEPSRNVSGISSWDTGCWGSLAGSNVLLCQNRLSGLKAEPWEQRGLTLYTLVSRLQKQKKHIWLHVTLLATSLPVLRDLLHVSIL
jgi:hypothetical protein